MNTGSSDPCAGGIIVGWQSDIHPHVSAAVMRLWATDFRNSIIALAQC